MKTSIKAIILATAASGVAVPTVAQAANFQYDGVELSYITGEVEGGGPFSDFDVDAATIELNYSVTPNIVVGGAYLSGSGKPDVAVQAGGTRSVDYKATGPALLAFYHADINEKMAYKIGARYSKIKNKFSAENLTGLEQFNSNEDSKSVIGGIRYQFNERIELGVGAEYDLDADSGEDELSYELGARYQVMPDLDVSFNVDFVDGGRSLRASVKKYLDFSR